MPGEDTRQESGETMNGKPGWNNKHFANKMIRFSITFV